MKTLFFILCLSISFILKSQTGWHLSLLSNFNDPNLPTIHTGIIGDQVWNSCKGWADTIKHKEYAIAGSIDSIYFFDITNPNVMKKVAVQSGLNRGENRDFDIYDHYIYCVSDNQISGSGKMQIFDLQYLPDSVHKVYESDTTGMNTHTVFVDKQNKRLYKCINRFKNSSLVSCMDVYSIANPLNLVFLFRFDRNNYNDVHECYARNNIVYCSSGYQGLFIFDVNDVNHPKEIGSITPPYPENAYNHSNWLDSSGRYMIFTDETADGTGIKIYDNSDIYNPVAVGAPFRNYGSPHNVYWVGRFAIASMYYGGVNIYDVNDMYSPKLVAYYHTFDKPHTTGVYEGCWGVYPFLPSGNIIASDMNTGIFLLKPSPFLVTPAAVPTYTGIDHMYYSIQTGITTFTLGVSSVENTLVNYDLYPVPFEKTFNLKISSTQKYTAHLLVSDIEGKIAVDKMIDISIGKNEFIIDQLQYSSEGSYIFRLISEQSIITRLIVKNK